MLLFWLVLIVPLLLGLNPVSSINLKSKGLKRVPENLGNDVLVDLSHNKIERIDKPVFATHTEVIYLNDNLLGYISPDVFRHIYNLILLDLDNNRLHNFEIDFNFLKGTIDKVDIRLNRNVHLSLDSK